MELILAYLEEAAIGIALVVINLIGVITGKTPKSAEKLKKWREKRIAKLDSKNLKAVKKMQKRTAEKEKLEEELKK